MIEATILLWCEAGPGMQFGILLQVNFSMGEEIICGAYFRLPLRLSHVCYIVDQYGLDLNPLLPKDPTSRGLPGHHIEETGTQETQNSWLKIYTLVQTRIIFVT